MDDRMDKRTCKEIGGRIEGDFCAIDVKVGENMNSTIRIREGTKFDKNNVKFQSGQ
jgi:hypothetical protein